MKLINHTIKSKKYIVDNNKNINKKIVLLSDIHYSYKFKKEKIDILLNKLKEIKPDYICITGDTIDYLEIFEDKKLIDEVLEFLTKMGKICPTIMCFGNHEFLSMKKTKTKKIKKYFYDSKLIRDWQNEVNKIKNVYLLDNEVVTFDNINFIGLTLTKDYYLKEQEEHNIINEINNSLPSFDDKYDILLVHSPLHILDEETIINTGVKKIDLIFAGHTHNGVVPPILDDLIKSNNGIFGPNAEWFKKTGICRGRYDYKDKTLIINGAVTKMHECCGSIFNPLNELFPMSIDIIELKNK